MWSWGGEHEIERGWGELKRGEPGERAGPALEPPYCLALGHRRACAEGGARAAEMLRQEGAAQSSERSEVRHAHLPRAGDFGKSQGSG